MILRYLFLFLLEIYVVPDGWSFETNSGIISLIFNPIALRKAKTLLSFGHSDCNRVNQ